VIFKGFFPWKHKKSAFVSKKYFCGKNPLEITKHVSKWVFLGETPPSTSSVYNVDGTLNKAGSITEVVDLILRYQNYLEQTLFTVTGLGKQKLILGHSWLWKHNLEIDWVTRAVKMSRCPPRCCSGCRDKA